MANHESYNLADTEPPPGKYGDPNLIIRIVPADEHLREALNRYGLPPDLAGALRSDIFPLFHTGLPDGDATYEAQVTRSLTQTATTAHSIIGALYAQPAKSDYRAPIAKPQELRTILNELSAQTKQGITALGGIGTISPQLQLLYWEEGFPIDDDEDLIVTLEESDLLTVYSSLTEVPDPLTFAALSPKLRAARPPDLSLETLQERFDVSMKLLEFDLALCILQDLEQYSVLGRSAHKTALMLAKSYKEIIFSSNTLLSKQKLLYILAQRWKQEAKAAPKRITKAMFNALGENAQKIAEDSEVYLQFFTTVFMTLPPHKLPPLLEETPACVLESSEKSSPDTAHSAGVVAVGSAAAAPPIPESDPSLQKVREEVHALRSALEERAKRWMLTPSKSKTFAMTQLYATLREGVSLHRDIPGTCSWELPAMPEEEAAYLLGIIVYAHEISEKLKEGTQGKGKIEPYAVYEAMAQDCEELIDGNVALYQYAANQGYNQFGGANLPGDFRDSLHYIADNWHIFRRLLATLGPEQKTPRLVGNLWHILPKPHKNSNYARFRRDFLIALSSHDVYSVKQLP